METKSTCSYCGVGCGVIIEHDATRITGVRGDPEHPANFGRLCTKGNTLHLTVTPQALAQRLTHPQLRRDKAALREQVGWDTALDHAADRFAQVIAEHGADSVAFYISGQLLTEDYYVFNKLAKGLIGTNNVDTNSRLCMSSAVAGYKATLGADAPPCAYEDIDHADCLLIAGSNTAWAHPVLFRRIEDARKARPAMKLIVVDPRRTDTAEAADLHLAILPGTDIALYNAMLHVLLWEDLCDLDFIGAHTEGFATLKALVRDYTPTMAADICGIKAEDIVTAARWFGQAPTALSLYCQGLNQSSHGTDNNAAIIHLHLATGKIGKPGCGPFSLTGQPNAMGGREVGGMANLLSAHRDLANPEHRAEVARLWGVPEVPAKPGLTAVELFEAVQRGEIKALWIACTNPAQSLPDLTRVHEALARCPFVVLQEVSPHTDTAAFADLLLPAAGWGEKEGTVTNSERRISRVRAAVAPPGEARADWRIAVDFAQRLESRIRPDATTLFPYATAESVFNEHRASTVGRDLDIGGLSYAVLDGKGPQQWPMCAGASAGTPRLYADGVFPSTNGRAIFKAVNHRPTSEATDARLPLHLNSGRLRDQWHGMSRTGVVPRLFAHAPEPVLEMNARDMERRGLVNGDLVRVKGKRGALVLRAAASSRLRPAQTYLPMHWGARFMSGLGVNALMPAVTDPVSHQPELKHAAVQVERFATDWQLVALRRDEWASRGGLHATLQPWLARFDHATLTLSGRESTVVVLRAWGGAGSALPTADLLAELSAAIGLDRPDVLAFNDARRGIAKRALIEDDCLIGALLCNETRATDWLMDLIARGGSTQELRKWLFAPCAAPPTASPARGRIVCNCFDVAESEILADFASGLDLAAVQTKRKCGTSCGSCRTELHRLQGQGASKTQMDPIVKTESCRV
ncbi:MAG: molybdopterin-dependent oxidoreductase [Propionivibrio sp.]|uniref:nitrate reductase n=1 Tax=Propionivibrio sp. TaxID=2212460 RepID=UPI001A5484DE|nr:nitrate reductase [Propionivibrio sp.]MBL8414077.1 molybdopterin-dependent oxidoreductase [Propionivibrio sp.]